MATAVVTEGLEMGQPTEDGEIEFVAKNFDELPPGQVVSNTFNYNGNSWKLEAWKSGSRQDLVSVLGQLELVNKVSVKTITARICCEADWETLYYEKARSIPTIFTFKGVLPFKDLKFEVQLKHDIKKWSPSSLAADYLKWFESEDFGDITIVAADGKSFSCHRNILARRSEVFAGMFSSGMKEARENVVDIEDFNGDIVAQLLLYLYTDECQVDKIADRIYAAAHKYQLDRLKIQCETVLAANLSPKSVVKTYRLAKFYHLDNLLARCVDYLDTHKAELSVADLLDELMAIQEGNEGQVEQK